MPTCAFVTFGCKVNQYDTQAMRDACASHGVRLMSADDPAEVYVINSCSVTADADREALRTVRRIRRRHATARIILTGCLVDRKLKVLDGVDLVVPTRQKHLIADLITDAQAWDTFQPCFEGGYSPLAISQFAGHTRAFVKIQDGCNYNCSFCKIPQVRGRSVSRPMSEILAEARRLIAAGYRELVLTGVSLGNYGMEWSEGPRLSDVVEALAQVEGGCRVRLSSVEPADVTPRLLALLARSRVMCRHLHLPLQSGSNRLLALMRRHYTVEQYRELVARARQQIPDLSVTTDLIVGFPTETDDDHAKTVAFLEALQPVRVHLFSYSPRRGTWAATLAAPVEASLVQRRMAQLRVLQAALTSHALTQRVGNELEVLVERARDPQTGLLEGYSDTYLKCLLDGPDSLMNHLVRVRVVEARCDHVLVRPL